MYVTSRNPEAGNKAVEELKGTGAPELRVCFLFFIFYFCFFVLFCFFFCFCFLDFLLCGKKEAFRLKVFCRR